LLNGFSKYAGDSFKAPPAYLNETVNEAKAVFTQIRYSSFVAPTSIERCIKKKTSKSRKREISRMTKEETKALIQRMYDAFNTKNIAAADEIFAPDFYSHPLKTGVEGVKKSWASMLQAFPDAQAIVEEMLVDRDKVASRTSIHGVPALADGTQPMILEIIRVKDQRIAELWGLTNLGEVLKQI
jgi:predicted ester cyclase